MHVREARNVVCLVGGDGLRRHCSGEDAGCGDCGDQQRTRVGDDLYSVLSELSRG